MRTKLAFLASPSFPDGTRARSVPAQELNAYHVLHGEYVEVGDFGFGRLGRRAGIRISARYANEHQHAQECRHPSGVSFAFHTISSFAFGMMQLSHKYNFFQVPFSPPPAEEDFSRQIYFFLPPWYDQKKPSFANATV
jgi:hypothetical protein